MRPATQGEKAMKTSLKIAVLGSLAITLLAGCASYTGQTNDPNDPNRTRTGALIGAGIGAVAGLLSGHDATERRQRAMVGAGIGGLAGGAIGAYQDKQEAKLRQQTAGTGIEVSRVGDVITLNLPDGITFDTNKSDLKPQFYPALDKVASVLNEYNQTYIEVAGHTDSTGTDAINQPLSERRAASVSNYLASKGVNSARLNPVGYGSTRPIADNSTPQGRQKNRRVEINVVPVQAQS
jgi:outer membrane protein OmpA-like peptidoglycan-associated protein